MEQDGASMWSDYLRFHQLALQTQDVDPVYPVFRQFLRLEDYDPSGEHGYELSVCMVTWYQIASAAHAWYEGWIRDGAPEEQVPTGIERRGNRDPKQLVQNMRGWRDAAQSTFDGTLKSYLTADLSDDPVEAWRDVRRRIEAVPGNGRWASYKLAEILNKVNGLPLEFADMGHQNSSGPRHGLALIVPNLPTGNSPQDIARLDHISESLIEAMRLAGYKAPMEEVETTLCDFHALVDGRYYVGHDIDQMLEQINTRHAAPWKRSLLQARADVLDHDYLGELNGWTGVEAGRKRLYRDQGVLAIR